MHVKTTQGTNQIWSLYTGGLCIQVNNLERICLGFCIKRSCSACLLSLEQVGLYSMMMLKYTLHFMWNNPASQRTWLKYSPQETSLKTVYILQMVTTQTFMKLYILWQNAHCDKDPIVSCPSNNVQWNLSINSTCTVVPGF